jgi:hypothetical protein
MSASANQVDQSPHVADRLRSPEGLDSFLRSPIDPPFTNVANFNTLSNDELFVLASLANKALQERGATSTPSSISSKLPDMFDNAKFEQIACTGLKPRYDGTADALIPFLNSIHIRRQNEVWYPATFILQDSIQIDLIRHFSKVTSDTILLRAKELWQAPDAIVQRHTRGTATYNARLLGVFLMNSISYEFAALIHSRIDPDFSSDGPLLLFTMCTHIHRNHVAFVESVKNKIRLSTLSEFKDDIPTFLRFLQNNLRLITSTGAEDTSNNDLIPHILLQLRNTKIPLFQQSILKWHREYMENKLSTTPMKLVAMADDECQILKHSHQWVETIDPSIAAMQATLQITHGQSAEVFKSLAAHLSTLTQQHRDTSRVGNSDHYDKRYPNNNPDWLYSPPEDLSMSRYFHGKYWYFCTKCGRSGRWVCTHRDDTHRTSSPRRFHDGDRDYSRYQHPTDRHQNQYNGYHSQDYTTAYRDPYSDRRHPHDANYKRQLSRSRSPPTNRPESPAPSKHRQVSFRPPTPRQQQANLSLFDSISAFIGDAGAEN